MTPRPMILRRAVVNGLAGCLLAGPRLNAAQPAARRARIGVLANEDTPPWQGFRQGLRELGYIDGGNATVEWRWSDGRPERLAALAIELAGLEVEVIVASGTQAVRAAKQATVTIPVVMAVSQYPDRIGLVASLARPGGNVTGMTSMAPEVAGKRLQLLNGVAPGAQRIAAVFNPDSQVELLWLREAQSAAAALRVQVQPIEARTPDDFKAAFAAIAAHRSQALLVAANPVSFKGRQQIAEFALARKMPSLFEERTFVAAGGLLSYGPNFADLFRRAAGYVDRILKGAKPADLPVEQPTQFELVVNMKTARAISVTIPQSLLLRADEVIE
jgi:putative tryptophan/tyrosine transport system substrate-binding protein